MYNKKTMYNKENSSPDERRLQLDEHRLQQYNDLKPVTKRVLGWTLRAGVKMMKMILYTAFHLPGLVRKVAGSPKKKE
jgi:hypothetical protein